MASTQRTRVPVSAVLWYSVVRYLCGLYLLWIPQARESGVFTNIVWNCMFACRVCFCLPLCVNAVRLDCPPRPPFWICTLQGPFLAISAMELGELNANINVLLKKSSLCGFTVPISNI